MLPREYTLSQYDSSPHEELGISKNSGKTYKNTNFDKKDSLANHKSFMSSLNIPINEENCELSTLYWIPYFLWSLNIFMMFTYLKLSMFAGSSPCLSMYVLYCMCL
jgi:hypothetical protein